MSKSKKCQMPSNTDKVWTNSLRRAAMIMFYCVEVRISEQFFWSNGPEPYWTLLYQRIVGYTVSFLPAICIPLILTTTLSSLICLQLSKIHSLVRTLSMVLLYTPDKIKIFMTLQIILMAYKIVKYSNPSLCKSNRFQKKCLVQSEFVQNENKYSMVNRCSIIYSSYK